MNKKFIGAIAMLTGLAACNTHTTENKTVKKDIITTNIDSTVNPADDFFDYANAGWIKKNPIPGDETSWGIAHLVQQELYDRLVHINNDAMAKHAASGVTQQIGDFWYAGMDTVNIEKNGMAPLQEELAKINTLQTPKDVMTQAAHMHTYGVNVFYDEGVAQDSKNSDANAYYMTQGGIGLPNRDYYFNTDARTVKIRNAYPAYVAEVFRLMGTDTATARAKAIAVIALETKLAQSSRKLEDLRDPYKNYNKMAINSLHTLSPNVEWPDYLQIMGVKAVDSVIIGQPEFYKALDKVLSTEQMQTLKDYMAFHLVRTYSPYLSKPFVASSFNFYSKLIRGAEQQRPRWKRVLDAQEHAMGEAVGQLFAKEYFNEKAKARYAQIVENVRAAYKARMEKLDWMSDSTKQTALHKLAAIRKKVGYPDKWKDFSALKIDRNAFATNMMRANQWWNNYGMNKLGKPVDRDEWDMTPQTYNAYYNPSNNEIVLPAGIFTVPGYRDEELDDALVYGYAAASTVGHEITHGFDDEGRQYDEHGNLHNWWTKKDEEEFKKRADVLIKQFNGMVAVDTIHINGKASLGENLADLGGLLIGFDAFKLTDCYKKGDKVHGQTPAQRFFLGYALGWMYEIRNEQLASQILTDVHAPAKFRVNGPLPNVPAFYDAFSVQPANKMYLPDSARVRLW
ncbi:MAG: M13 family metallopeptidase [Taibaiella sp.]|nr:M13 family metallopeptidase [Taibaiella sp.]